MTGIETIALVGMAAGAAMSAVGSIQQGYAQKQVNQFNAQVAENNAASARAAAALDEANVRRRNEAIQGSVRARAAAATGDLGGSPLDLLASNASEAELEALTARYSGEVAAGRQESQAQLDQMLGKQAVMRGYAGAAETLLSTASRAYTQYGGKGAGGGTGALAQTVPYLSSTGRKIGPV